MTRSTANWIKYSNLVPMTITVLSGLIAIVAFWFMLNTKIELILQNLMTINDKLSTSIQYSQINRDKIIDIDKRVNTLEILLEEHDKQTKQ